FTCSLQSRRRSLSSSPGPRPTQCERTWVGTGQASGGSGSWSPQRSSSSSPTATCACPPTSASCSASSISVFVALSLWMILSNTGDLTLQTFNPPTNEVGTFEGTFKGMVFAILAFIGFEAAAPLGEEARNPRRTIPRAVIGSALIVGLFYVFSSYAWVIGTGFNN